VSLRSSLTWANRRSSRRLAPPYAELGLGGTGCGGPGLGGAAGVIRSRRCVALNAFAMCPCALFSVTSVSSVSSVTSVTSVTSVSSVTSVTSVTSESQTSCRRRDRMPVGFVAHVTLQPSRSSAVQGGDVSPVHERTAGKPAVASKRDPDDIRMASSACVVSRWMPRSALPDRESARGRRIAVLTVQPPTNHPSAGVRTSRRPWPGPR